MLGALLLVPLLIIAYVLIQRRKRKYALRYASLSLVREAMGPGPGIRRHIPPALFLAGIAIAIFATARPSTSVLLPLPQGTIILTIDVSGSMRADDLKPSRLEAAKAAARAFVDKQPRHVRIGVVSFSGSASIVQAPTTDRDTITAAIGRLSTQRATAIGSAILTSLEALAEQPGVKPTPYSGVLQSLPSPTAIPTPMARGAYASAAIILLSDGQSNTGPQPLKVVKQATDRGVRVYTVGVGTPEGSIQNFEGRSIRVRLDEDTLKKIAEETDATYVKADTETDLRQIYENLSNSIVFQVEKTEVTAGFTGLAALVLIAAAILSLMWFNRLI
jgi:Ca-activated chloride channel family protein